MVFRARPWITLAEATMTTFLPPAPSPTLNNSLPLPTEVPSLLPFSSAHDGWRTGHPPGCPRSVHDDLCSPVRDVRGLCDSSSERLIAGTPAPRLCLFRGARGLGRGSFRTTGQGRAAIPVSQTISIPGWRLLGTCSFGQKVLELGGPRAAGTNEAHGDPGLPSRVAESSDEGVVHEWPPDQRRVQTAWPSCRH